MRCKSIKICETSKQIVVKVRKKLFLPKILLKMIVDELLIVDLFLIKS